MDKLRLQYLTKELKSGIIYRIRKVALNFGKFPEFSFIFLSISITLVIGISWLAISKFTFGVNVGLIQTASTESLQYWGQLGDFFGGLLNPLLSFMALVAVLHSIKIQRKELQETQQETKIANKIQAQQTALFERQNFESFFFRLLEAHSKILDQVSFDDEKGVAAFESAARKMDHVYFANITSAERTEHELTRVYGLKNQQQEEFFSFVKYIEAHSKNEAVTKTLKLSAETVLENPSSRSFSLYFRNIYQLLKVIDNARFDGFLDAEKPMRRTMRLLRLDYYHKRQYANILRAQLSEAELRAIFYNCLTEAGGGLKVYVEKYSLLKHLINAEFKPPHYYRNVYQNIAFSDYEMLDDSTIRNYATKKIERNIKSIYGRD